MIHIADDGRTLRLRLKIRVGNFRFLEFDIVFFDVCENRLDVGRGRAVIPAQFAERYFHFSGADQHMLHHRDAQPPLQLVK